MATAPQPHQNDVPAQEFKTTTIVYERCVTREIRVLEKKIGRLELQLNNEMEKISSCSGLLEEIIVKPQSSPCSLLRAELDRARNKQERAYQKFQRQQQEMAEEIQQGDDDDNNNNNGNGHGAATSNNPALAAAGTSN